MGNLVVLGTAVQKRMEAFYSGRTPLKVDYRERAGIYVSVYVSLS